MTSETSRPGPRVVVLATTLPARQGDGTPEFVLTLAKACRREGLAVELIAPRTRGSSAHEVVSGVTVHRFRYFPARWEDLADGAIVPNLRARPSRWLQVLPLVVGLWWAARRATRHDTECVVHAHWIIPAGLVARAVRRPYVVTAHGADVYALNGRPFRWGKRWALRRAAAVMPVSHAIAVRLAQLGSARLHAPVPMGVDLADIPRETLERRPVPGRVLFVGRLADKKGVDDLIDAVLAAPEMELHVVGDGPERSALERRAATAGGRIQFLGQLPRHDVFVEMQQAALIALPSKTGADGDEDGVPVVLAEAMAIGVPLVVSDAGGLSEHVADGVTGWVVRAGSVDDLGRVLRSALADPQQATRRAEQARRHLDAELTAEAIGRTYADVLREAARR